MRNICFKKKQMHAVTVKVCKWNGPFNIHMTTFPFRRLLQCKQKCPTVSAVFSYRDGSVRWLYV